MPTESTGPRTPPDIPPEVPARTDLDVLFAAATVHAARRELRLARGEYAPAVGPLGEPAAARIVADLLGADRARQVKSAAGIIAAIAEGPASTTINSTQRSERADNNS